MNDQSFDASTLLSDAQIQDKDAALAYLNYVSTLLDALKDSLVSRSNLLLAANGVIIGILSLIVTSDATSWVVNDLTAIILLCITFCFLILSLYYALFVIRVFKPQNINMKELMHFRVILQMGENNICTFVKSMNQKSLISVFINQIFGLSRYIEKRYDYLHKAFCFFMACLVSFIMTIFYITITPNKNIENLILNCTDCFIR